ncbi:hypothetical protein AB0I81_36160 [Nonomuraea sp. NPDC050404]|uniref:hypothetical protein n=1 Tax=Nonomuraea sp. NPDC050404 TaxID=3155783 RepID=UPI003406F70B
MASHAYLTGTRPLPAAAYLNLLYLPVPGARFRARCDSPVGRESGSAPPPAPGDPDIRVRYRWILGHHAAFMVWRLISERLESIASDNSPNRADVTDAARLHDIYAALFVYTGSCSPERYAATVRADMRACHPAFSGEWAPDHAPIRPLLDRVRAAHPRRRLEPLPSAVRDCHSVHRAIADRLVPEGGSLLRDAGREPGQPPTEVEHTLYDGFFRVVRRPTCRACFDSQLLDRTEQMLRDLAAHGLTDRRGPRPPLGAATVRNRIEDLSRFAAHHGNARRVR